MSRLRASGLVTLAGSKRIGPVSLDVAPGRCVAVHGPSGSGKTTVLRALAALDPAESGALTFDERAPEDWGVPAYRRRVVLLTGPPALGHDTVQVALRRPFEFATAAGAEFPEAEAEALLEALGLPDIGARSVERLSSGERQRVALVRALLVGPKILLADEPTSALDPASVEAAERALGAALDRGMGMVLVSHDADQRGRLAHETVSLP